MVGVVNVNLARLRHSRPDEVPVTGIVDAEYRNRAGAVVIHAVDVHTPASEIQVSGSLGVYPMTRPSQIDASLVTRNIAEFNPVLAAFGISAPGQPTPIPAELHGAGAVPRHGHRQPPLARVQRPPAGHRLQHRRTRSQRRRDPGRQPHPLRQPLHRRRLQRRRAFRQPRHAGAGQNHHRFFRRRPWARQRTRRSSSRTPPRSMPASR